MILDILYTFTESISLNTLKLCTVTYSRLSMKGNYLCNVWLLNDIQETMIMTIIYVYTSEIAIGTIYWPESRPKPKTRGRGPTEPELFVIHPPDTRYRSVGRESVGRFVPKMTEIPKMAFFDPDFFILYL